MAEPNGSVASATGESGKNGSETVPASELLQLKESLGAALSEKEKQFSLLTERFNAESAARQAVEAKVKELTPLAAELTTLKPKYEAQNTRLQQIETAALENRKRLLTEKYGVPVEKVKNLGADQLSILEDMLPTVAKPVITARGLDGGSQGAPGPDSNLSPRDRIAAALKSGK